MAAKIKTTNSTKNSSINVNAFSCLLKFGFGFIVEVELNGGLKISDL